jgi:hypothetical protein
MVNGYSGYSLGSSVVTVAAFSSASWTGLGDRILRCPSTTPDGKASFEIAPVATARKMQPASRFGRNDDITSLKNLGGIDCSIPPSYKQ